MSGTFGKLKRSGFKGAGSDSGAHGCRRHRASRSAQAAVEHVIQGRPDVAVIGTLCNGIDASGREVRPRDRWRLVRRSVYIPFPHGSAMFRRDVFDQVGGYDETSEGGEDQDLFSRMAARGRVLTLPDVLYSYRYHSSNATLFNGARAVGESFSKRQRVGCILYAWRNATLGR